MAAVKKDKKFWVGRLLLAVLFIFSAWVYYQLNLNYRNLQSTNEAFEFLSVRQAALSKQYAAEVVVAKKKVAEAEQIVARLTQEKDVLRQENAVLEQKVKLLDKMAELEANITDLRDKNTQLLVEIDRLEKEALLHPEKIKSLDEGKAMMSKFRQKVRVLDRRMSEIKNEMFTAKVEAQKKLDEKRSLAGNNGYLIRNGMVMPQEIILTTGDVNKKVNVEFVK